MKTLRRLVLFGVLFAAASAGAGEVIVYQAKEAYPEGIAYYRKTDRFVVSSMRQGTIGTVDRKGRYAELIKDNSLISSAGIAVDELRNRLLVCVNDSGVSVHTSSATQGKLARLVIFNLDTQKRSAVIDLGNLVPGGGHFANDMAVDQWGNAYVTDSFSPVIYKVDPLGKPSVFLRNEMFAGEGFNLNGIVVHPKGYLLVAKYNTGEIYKISVANPANISKVALSEALPGADGLLLDDAGALIVVQNMGADRAVRLVSRDEWVTAEVKAVAANALAFPTTAVRAGTKTYVNNARLGELFDATAPKTRAEFSIEELEFK